MMLLLLAALFSIGAPGSESASIATIAESLRAHEFRHALQLSTEALQSNAHDPRLWTLNAFAEQGLNQNKEALESYARALALEPHYVPALKGKAQLEYQIGDADAVRTLRLVVEQVPNDPVAHAMLGALSFQKHDCKTAVAEYRAGEAAIRSEPAAFSQLGECLLKTGEHEKAIDALQQAASLRPTDFRLTYNLALAEFQSGDASAALKTLQPLLEGKRRSDAPSELLELASTIEEAKGNTPQAVSILRQAIVQKPDDATLYLAFTNLAFAHESFQVGIDMLTAGLTRLPKSAQLYTARGVLFVQIGDYEKAEADFDKANELDPSQSFGSLAQGLTALQQSKFNQALATTEAELRRSPHDAFLYYLKAETLNRRGLQPGSLELQQAIAAAHEAVRLRPDFSLAEDLLGSLYLKDAKPDLARKQFESTLKHDPADQAALYHLMLLERSAGESEKAQEFLKRLAAAKAQGQKSEEQATRYRLVEVGKPLSSGQ